MCKPSKKEKTNKYGGTNIYRNCMFHCPLYKWSEKTRNKRLATHKCYLNLSYIPDDAPIQKLVQEWSDRHEEFTRLEQLLKAFPDTPLENGLPKFCPDLIGYKTDSEYGKPNNQTEKCHTCWNKID